MKDSEVFALNQLLDKYPQNAAFDNILVLINNNSDEVSIKNEYSKVEPIAIVLSLLNIVEDLDKYFFPIHELVTVIDRDTISEKMSKILKRKPTENEVDKLSTFLDDHFSNYLDMTIEAALPLLNIHNK